MKRDAVHCVVVIPKNPPRPVMTPSRPSFGTAQPSVTAPLGRISPHENEQRTPAKLEFSSRPPDPRPHAPQPTHICRPRGVSLSGRHGQADGRLTSDYA